MPKRTPFYEIHKKYGAKLTDFGGFDMPVQYDSIRKEHRAVRERVGIFDVSHMGEFFVEGPGAFDLIQQVTINNVSKLSPGKAQYSAMCYDDGGIVDDLLVYMLDEDRYLLVVNASNIEKDFAWVKEHNTYEAKFDNKSEDYGLLTVQGPRSVDTLQKLIAIDLSEIEFYTFKTVVLAGYDNILLSATGYTGEKGFELYFDKHLMAPDTLWDAIMEAGKEFDIKPCGLGARDTLRLEMGFALYGNDITKDTNPLAARLGWLTKLNAEDFIGKKAIVKIKKEGVERMLVGFIVDDPRSIPRAGYTIIDQKNNEIGFVTSGTRSITLNKNIGMGYIKSEYASEGTKIRIVIRNKQAEATVSSLPFFKKNEH